MSVFYNENDPYPAAWLRNLIAAGHIAKGVVDERSVRELEPADIGDARQAHFFAGIGVWSHALRLAGWPDARPVWTGSCPCQPFSIAGRRRGTEDDRHLWPAWFRLIRECRPPVVFGEQVGGLAGLSWLDLVHADLEGEGYAVGAADLCAAGVGAPHIRQRLFFVAIAAGLRHERSGVSWRGRHRSEDNSDACLMEHAVRAGLAQQFGEFGTPCLKGAPIARETAERASPPAFWTVEWIACRDGKLRPVEPGTFPLAHGSPARMGRLRAYGNAIVAPLAAEFVVAAMDCLP